MATYNSSFNNPYPSGWKNTPEQTTPITAEALQAHTDALQAIDNYLSENPIPESGGGGTGTTNYNDLTNKPSINGVELNGNKTSEQLGISGGTDDYEELNNKPKINGVEISGNLTAEDLGLSGGGTGGTDNYIALSNKPSIEGVELVGDKTLADFGGKKQIKISWADYQALSTEEQNDESIVYYIHDYPSNIINAADISYDNATSGLTADEVQGAIDELNSEKVTIGSNAHLDRVILGGSQYAMIYVEDDDVVFRFKKDDANAYFTLNGIFNSLNAKLPLAGGSMIGDLKTTNIYGTTPNQMVVGSSTSPYKVMRSNQFVVTDAVKNYGNLSINTEGTAETLGLSILTIGNNTPGGEAGNARGWLRIHDSNYYRHDILPNDNLTGNVTQYLSSKSGTIPTVSLNGTTLTINL